jgi:hypothetical protein
MAIVWPQKKSWCHAAIQGVKVIFAGWYQVKIM